MSRKQSFPPIFRVEEPWPLTEKLGHQQKFSKEKIPEKKSPEPEKIPERFLSVPKEADLENTRIGIWIVRVGRLGKSTPVGLNSTDPFSDPFKLSLEHKVVFKYRAKGRDKQLVFLVEGEKIKISGEVERAEFDHQMIRDPNSRLPEHERELVPEDSIMILIPEDFEDVEKDSIEFL